MTRPIKISSLSLMLGSVCFGTTIVGVRTPTAIVIGADSKVGRGDAPGVLPNGCKIGIANNVVWGYAGVLAVPTVGFSLESEAEKFMSANEPFDSRVKKFETEVTERLDDIISRLKIGEPKYVANSVDGRMVTEILFAGEDQGLLRMIERRFVVRKGAGRVSVIRSDFPSARHPESGWSALGQFEAIGKEMRAKPNLFDSGLEMGVERLIQVEIVERPEDVGPPVAVVRIEKNSIAWVKMGACQ